MDFFFASDEDLEKKKRKTKKCEAMQKKERLKRKNSVLNHDHIFESGIYNGRKFRNVGI